MTVPPQVIRSAMSSDVPSTTNCYTDSSLDGAETPHAVNHNGRQVLNDSGEGIVVGAVGSAALWFLRGWAGGIEVEFMIDKGCQMTILATSLFDRMCVTDPRLCSRLCPCGRRLVSADSSPLMVRGKLDMTIAFLGLSCDMVMVVAGIGSDGLLGTEALQSCLPHQLDLRTGQLWADGRSTQQVHQQRQASPHASAHLTTSVVQPPDSEIVAVVSVRSPSGIRPGPCSLVEPCMALTEDGFNIVGRTLVDASSLSASVLMVNPSSEMVVLPSFSCVGDLVPVSAVSLARSELGPPEMDSPLLDHLEDIVGDLIPSWERSAG